ncbi:OmpA family protein [Parvibaculum sedimenti]|uniref:OmpA family protein n=1 Tax=Parvibaculum sedimenti TaxID=2608632 RepID=A0A6N6VMK0_9HYPH|nr:OmpA family protein [Parvibaculum sedimenti]KAB7740788.1 OmpA family protein [Parvibaculum sedimenti]
MHFLSKHLTSLACRIGLAAALALTAAGAASAAPVDAVPMERPGTRIITTPEAPEPTPLPSIPAMPVPDAPAAAQTQPSAATQLHAAEPALLRVAFGRQDATPTPQAAADVKAFAANFKQHGGRVTLKAYAGAAGDDGTNARRLSLKRALAVREILLSEGIAAERLNVRALGGARDTGPLDRVDIVRTGG